MISPLRGLLQVKNISKKFNYKMKLFFGEIIPDVKIND